MVVKGKVRRLYRELATSMEEPRLDLFQGIKGRGGPAHGKRNFCVEISTAENKPRYHTNFNVDVTPPLLMVSLCSVNTKSFERGYSLPPVGCSGSDGVGVKKNMRPDGVCQRFRYRYIRKTSSHVNLTVLVFAKTLDKKWSSPLRFGAILSPDSVTAAACTKASSNSGKAGTSRVSPLG